MKKHLLIFSALMMVSSALFAQPVVQQEFRGAWIATVTNIDWPRNRTHTVATQQAHLIDEIERIKNSGMNAVFFQVRTETDALYASEIEPWSYWLTNSEGTPPNPFWDPLEFAIREAHARGLELHAWLNPYRSVRDINSSIQRSPNHISVKHPERILTVGSIKILDPGLPENIEYINEVVMDIVTRYDVDGIHFDDYFYPYAPNTITNQDAATYATYGGGFNNIGDWRRDNVNRMIKLVHDSIKEEKPHVKFGISPFGIWRPGNPSGIVGTDAYATLFADAKAWIRDESVDYLIPQLYWAFGGGQDYALLAPWWANEAQDKHLYTGNAVYKMTGSWNWPTMEIGNQIRFNHRNDKILGQVMFSSQHIRNNLKGIADTLRTNLYARPALTPTMDWMDTSVPPEPLSLTWEWQNEAEKRIKLSWEKPEYNKAGNDSLLRFAIFRYNATGIPNFEEVLADPDNFVALIGTREYETVVPESDDPYYYFVASVSRNSVLSTEPVLVEIPSSTSIETGDQIASRIELEQNYPNPFNPSTRIRFRIAEAGYTSLRVFDLMGREMAVLVNDELPSGSHTISFDATGLASGMYIYRLQSSGETLTGKMLFLK